MTKDFDETGLMLSVLVHYLDTNDAGPGFYKLAAALGVLPQQSSSTAKERFWTTHLNAVYDHYSPRKH